MATASPTTGGTDTTRHSLEAIPFLWNSAPLRQLGEGGGGAAWGDNAEEEQEEEEDGGRGVGASSGVNSGGRFSSFQHVDEDVRGLCVGWRARVVPAIAS